MFILFILFFSGMWLFPVPHTQKSTHVAGYSLFLWPVLQYSGQRFPKLRPKLKFNTNNHLISIIMNMKITGPPQVGGHFNFVVPI